MAQESSPNGMGRRRTHRRVRIQAESPQATSARKDSEDEETPQAFVEEETASGGSGGEIGPRGSFSQISLRGAKASETERVVSTANKQNRKLNRNRRLQPAHSLHASDLQKVLVAIQLADAGELWKRLEFPARLGAVNILDEYPNNAVM